MTRSARHAALGALIALVGCSVYDRSLLAGGVGEAGGLSAEGGSGSSVGGTGLVSGRGGTTGGSTSSGGRGSSAGSGATAGGSAGAAGGSKGGTGGDGTSATGGSGAVGGPSAGGTGNVDSAGGTGNIDSAGGMGNEGGAPEPSAGGTSGSGAGGNDPGAGGSAGMGTGGGAGGPPVTATGCAKLSASLTASTDKTHYLITLGSADVDLTDAVVNVHLYAQGGDGGVFMYVQQSTFEFYGMPLVPFSTFSGWTTLSWDLSAATATSPVDKAKVRRLGIEIGGTGGTNFVNPTVVYVDAVTVTTPTISFSFDAASSVNTTPTTFHAGDTALWQNSASADTTASGSILEWVSSCP